MKKNEKVSRLYKACAYGETTMRRRQRFAFILLALVTCLSLPAGASAPAIRDAAKEKAIRRLLDLTGTAKQAEYVVAQMMDSLEKSSPTAPPGFFAEFRKKIKASDF